MKFFIPAWYSEEHWWQSNAKPAFLKKSKTEFDDLISLMGMHVKNKRSFEMLILNYSPDLRTFLHRYDLFDAGYWSVFDAIQGFTHQTPQSVDYRTLDWPEDTEFIYAPSYIRAFTAENQYSNIHFSQDGYLVWIESFENHLQRYRYIFDDRGYLSSVVSYNQQGEAERQFYMTLDGDWVMQEDLLSGKVKIHRNYYHLFNHRVYLRMNEVIDEWLSRYFKQRAGDFETVIAASDIRHNTMIANHVASEQLCFSIFQQRATSLEERRMPAIEKGKYWLVDTIENAEKLYRYQNQYHCENQILRITPFDVQVNANISSQLYEMNIGVWVDGMSQDTFRNVMSQLEHEMQQHSQVRVVLLSKQTDVLPQWVSETMQNVNEALNEKQQAPEMIRDIVNKEATKYVVLKSVPFENQLVEVVRTLRLVIDLNHEPDLFLQICAIGAGLPQINRNPTDYVKHIMNGYLINDINDLSIATDYFLNHLKNWNQAFAYSMKLAKHYSSSQILTQLDERRLRDKNGT